MQSARLVVWAQYGIYGAGKDLDETFGLIETAEKAAEIYMKIAHLPLLNTITDEQMHRLEDHFGVKAWESAICAGRRPQMRCSATGLRSLRSPLRRAQRPPGDGSRQPLSHP